MAKHYDNKMESIITNKMTSNAVPGILVLCELLDKELRKRLLEFDEFEFKFEKKYEF